MNTQALYVYQTIDLGIQGVVEPLLLASGKPAGGQLTGDASLDPGLYRLPDTTELIPASSAAGSGDLPSFEVRAMPNDSGSKGGSGDPPPRRALVMLAKPGETTDQTTARIIAVTNGQGAKTTLNPNKS